MKEVKFLAYVLAVSLLLALALGVGLGLAQGQEPLEEELQPQGEVSIAATVGSKFSYQGVLKENGSPATGSRDMTFRLYSDDTCSTQVGGDIVKSGVQVTDGLFSVELDVTHSDLYGQGLWLEVEVGGTKIGCQEILPVPYALSLRPGARIANDSTINFAAGVIGEVTSTAPGGYSAGVRGINNGTLGNGIGVYGSQDGSGWGVYGHVDGDGRGVYGRADGAGGVGVYGSSETGTAIFASGTGHVKQVRTGNGLVKAAVSVNCNDDLLLGCIRAFNNVNSETIFCSPGLSDGYCTIDFGFDVSDRFWVASAIADPLFGYGVTCRQGSSSDQLDCVRWNGVTGLGADGPIMVLIH